MLSILPPFVCHYCQNASQPKKPRVLYLHPRSPCLCFQSSFWIYFIIVLWVHCWHFENYRSGSSEGETAESVCTAVNSSCSYHSLQSTGATSQKFDFFFSFFSCILSFERTHLRTKFDKVPSFWTCSLNGFQERGQEERMPGNEERLLFEMLPECQDISDDKSPQLRYKRLPLRKWMFCLDF